MIDILLRLIGMPLLRPMIKVRDTLFLDDSGTQLNVYVDMGTGVFYMARSPRDRCRAEYKGKM